MRPNKFKSETYKAIIHWLDTGSNEKFTPYLIQRMERAWEKCAKEEHDLRPGEEVYGYQDFYTIRSSMIYISDRFNCAMRLRWLLDGLRNGHI